MSEYGGTPGGEDVDAALAQLGRVITRAASVLAAIPGNDEATAYRCARALDAALGDLAELLRTVPGAVRSPATGRSWTSSRKPNETSRK